MVNKEENKAEALKRKIILEKGISEGEFRRRFMETLKAISVITDIYVNGKNGNVQPMRTG